MEPNDAPGAQSGTPPPESERRGGSSESPPAAHGPRLTERRAWIVLALGLATLFAGIGLVVSSQVGGPQGTRILVPGTEDVAALLEGIPQDGVVLGSPTAPVTLVEYADLQCPYCRAWAAAAFPELVKEYVRPGKVRVEFRGLAFLGPDSQTALRTALAAGLQDHLFETVELLYRNQGAENSGWVTPRLLRDIGESVQGLDTARMLDDADGAAVQDSMLRAAQAADASKIQGTPSFELGITGKELLRFQPAALSAAAFRPAIDSLLENGQPAAPNGR